MLAFFEIEGKEYILLGGEFTASGVINYLRPYEKLRRIGIMKIMQEVEKM